jgi:CRISPR/Cas system-associated exonuclease Cas4 (RecB family)
MNTPKQRFNQPWGFSKLDVYRTCPQKFEFQFIKKLPQPGSPAMERGSKMHAEIESYLNGWSQDLSPLVEDWKTAFDGLKREDFKGEQALGFDKDWMRLPDWFDKRTWLRVKMDAYFKKDDMVTVIDFKSGKYRQPSTDQIELYAIAGLSIFPSIKQVLAEFWFLDTNDVFRKLYTAEELLELRKKYEREIQPMYNDETWKPAPSNECRWCPYSKTKGGKCQF